MTYADSLRQCIKTIFEFNSTKTHIPNKHKLNSEPDYYFDEGKYRFYVYYRVNGICVEICDQVEENRRDYFDYQLFLTHDDSVRYFDTLMFEQSWFFNLCDTEEELFQSSLVNDMSDITLKDINDLINLKSIL